jgi:hypothetical protein
MLKPCSSGATQSEALGRGAAYERRVTGGYELLFDEAESWYQTANT